MKILRFLGLLCVFTAFMSLAPVESRAEGSSMRDSFLDKCSKKPDVEHCLDLYECSTNEIVKSGVLNKLGTEGGAQAMLKERDNASFRCAGRLNPPHLKNHCLKTCPQGKNCDEACVCLEKKLMAIGTEQEVGEFLLNDGGSTTEEYKIIVKSCMALKK
jgi:hypothetical protein